MSTGRLLALLILLPCSSVNLPMTSSYRVIWYEVGWWHEQRFPTQEAAKEFAGARSWQKKTEARLFVGGECLIDDVRPQRALPAGPIRRLHAIMRRRNRDEDAVYGTGPARSDGAG